MNFVSLTFLFFLMATLAGFFAVPARWRVALLAAASYLFYATWSLPFVGIILITTTTDYWMSRVIHRSPSPRTRKLALTAGLLINLLILCFFKYANFLLDTSHGLAHMLGYQLALPGALQIILPLGISFYTFEAISYMVDVYRGHEPAPSWMSYNFYIMYFPHLISGPIIRFSELWSQYKEPLQAPGMERIGQGVRLILLGYFFKVAIANQAAAIADPAFQFRHLPVLTMYLGVLAFTVQIYFDFMGYTHIARGVSLLFNIELPLNFNHPYLAANISDFWKRWHISLSRWIQDYLYIPLGGSRCTMPRAIANLMVTMVICGAWHGAGWTYLVWGAYHGLLLSVYQVFKRFRSRLIPHEAFLQSRLWHVASVALTFVAVVIGWIFFRADNLMTAFNMLGRLFHFKDLFENIGQSIQAGDVEIFAQFGLLLGCCFLGPNMARLLEKWYNPLPYWGKVSVVSALFLLCLLLTAEEVPPFIYFQF